MAEWLPTFMWALDGNSYSCAFESVAPAQLHIPNENNNFQNRTSVRRVAGIFCCLKALRLSCFGITWWSFVLWGSSWLTTLHTWKGRASVEELPLPVSDCPVGISVGGGVSIDAGRASLLWAAPSPGCMRKCHVFLLIIVYSGLSLFKKLYFIFIYVCLSMWARRGHWIPQSWSPGGCELQSWRTVTQSQPFCYNRR